MKFVLDAEQRLFAQTLDKLLTEAGTPSVIRSWAAGDHVSGKALWATIAEAGVFALAVPEAFDGVGPLPVELVIAVHELGRHAVPGPIVETLAAAALLSRVGGPYAADWLPRIAAGSALVSLAFPSVTATDGPHSGLPQRSLTLPYALDADIADLVLVADADGLHTGTPGVLRRSLDPARRLFEVARGGRLAADADAAAAHDLGALACAAQLTGLGRRLLEISVEYAKARQQFGRPIGEFQAIKHHLADALVALEYATPLLHGAALSYETPDFPRDVSAAKVAASQAAYTTAKIALQVHGAIGYTDEYDPSLWIRKIRALYTAWGTPATHRARVLAAL